MLNCIDLLGKHFIPSYLDIAISNKYMVEWKKC